MSDYTLADLRASILDTTAFTTLTDYIKIGYVFLKYVEETAPTRIICPTIRHYIFFQYGSNDAYKITRPLNSNLFFESSEAFQQACGRFIDFLGDLKRYQQNVASQSSRAVYIDSNELNKVVYTFQQAIGSISERPVASSRGTRPRHRPPLLKTRIKQGSELDNFLKI